MKVPSTAASPVKRTRAATNREQALRQLIAAAERLVEQGERAFFEIPIGRSTTEAGSARPTMYAPRTTRPARRPARSGFWHAIFHAILKVPPDLTATGGRPFGELAAKQYQLWPQPAQPVEDTHVARV